MTDDNLLELKKNEFNQVVDKFWSVVNYTTKFIKDLKDENLSLKQEVEALKVEKENAIITIGSYEQNFLLLKQEQENSILENQEYKKQIDEFQPILAEKKLLKTKLENLEITYKGVEQDLLILNDKLKQIEVLQNALDQKSNRVIELEKQNELLSKKKMELEDYQSHFGFAQKEITRRNFDLHQKEDIIQKQKDTIAQLESRVFKIKDLEKRIEEDKVSMVNLNSLLEQFKQEKIELQSNCDNIESISFSQVSELKDEILAKNSEIEQQNLTIKILNQKIDSLVQELSLTSQKLSVKEKENVRITEEMNKLQNDFNVQKLAFESVNKHNLTFIQKSIETNETIQQYELTLSKLERENQTLDESNYELNNQVINLGNKVKDLQESLNSGTHKLLESETLIIEFKNALDKLQNNLRDKEEEITRLYDTNSGLEGALTELESNLRATQKKLGEQEEKYLKLIEEYKIKNDDLQFILKGNLDTLNLIVKEKENISRSLDLLNQEYNLLKNQKPVVSLSQEEIDLLNINIIELNHLVGEKESKIKDFTYWLTDANEQITLLNFDIEIYESKLEQSKDLVLNLSQVIETKELLAQKSLDRVKELENLIRLRYEQIQLLEDEVNSLKENVINLEKKLLVADNKEIEKKEIATKLDTYVQNLEGLLSGENSKV